MRIAYLVHFRGGSESGILRKVAAQAAAWRTSGSEVGLFVATSPSATAAWEGLPQTVAVRTPPDGPLALLREREDLVRDAQAWGPDVVYVRHGLTHPALVRLARRVPLVIEINGNDLAEARLSSRRRYYVTRATRGVLLRHAAGLVFVTNELAAEDSFGTYGRPSVVIGNGIDLASIGETAAPSNPQPRMVFAGHPRSPWHGLDQIEILAVERPEWHFDIVGPDEDEMPTPLENVTAHGLLEPNDYERVRAGADVAIGSLAMYRAGIEEASTLKVREYLASGLPVLTGSQDTDFMDGADFLLRIPNRPDAVRSSLAEIDRFVDTWRGRRVPRAEVAHLDVSVKERARLGFIRGLVDV